MELWVSVPNAASWTSESLFQLQPLCDPHQKQPQLNHRPLRSAPRPKLPGAARWGAAFEDGRSATLRFPPRRSAGRGARQTAGAAHASGRAAAERPRSSATPDGPRAAAPPPPSLPPPAELRPRAAPRRPRSRPGSPRRPPLPPVSLSQLAVPSGRPAPSFPQNGRNSFRASPNDGAARGSGGARSGSPA